mmetsp:Transcript_12664/g.35634  ORF Transcript_12664/g.35634 Transcript_12664/m.35634 type:complete len:943 (+) Transcript_12664:317-3145(+)
MVNPAGSGGRGGAAGLRTAFRLRELHFHRAKNVITCVAVNESSQWLYLGFSDGQLEEHRLEVGEASLRCSLSARKAVSKKALEEIHHLEGARRLAVLSDSFVSLLDCDSLEKTVLSGFKGATAVCSDHSASYPSRLALATKVVLTTKKRARLSIFKVRGGTIHSDGPSSTGAALLVKSLDLEETHSLRRLAWTGGSVIAATNYRYLVVSLRDGSLTHLFDLPGSVGSASPRPPMLAPFPASATAMLLMEQVGLVVNSEGNPTGGTLAFPSEPLAFAQCGIYILALCSDGVTIYEQATAAPVQTIACSLSDEGGEAWASAAGTSTGSCVATASRRCVRLLQPVGLEVQARELLREGQHEPAQALAECAGPEGGRAPWRDIVLAESALMLLHELRFKEALAVAREVPLSLLGPVHLFPLFPQATAQWLADPQSPADKGHLWGIAPPLLELEAMVRAKTTAQPVDAAAVATKVSLGKRLIAEYLNEVRDKAGASPADGIDTLLLRLLIDTEDVEGLERLVSEPNLISIADVQAVLEGAGRSHALALLGAQQGRHGTALRIWHELANGRRREAPATTGVVAKAASTGAANPAAHVALLCVRDLLLGRLAGRRRLSGGSTEVPVRTVMEYLPWLLDSGEGAARGRLGLQVMCARQLPVPEVLRMLEQRPGHLRWKYLLHVIRNQGDEDTAHHSDLAFLLTDAILDRMAEQPAVAGRSAGADDYMEDTLEDMHAKLQAFLSDSTLYNVQAVLRRMQGTALWQEQVILHSKTGNHGQALRLLVIRIRDVKQALEYCSKPGRSGCHLQLLRILLSPGPGEEPMLQEACLLLNSAGGSDLDPMEVLTAMAGDLPLTRALPTLERILRERIHRARDRRLVCSLQRSVNLEAKGELAEAQQRSVVITEERACPWCHTRIGTRMFAVLPSGAVQCYRCYQKAQEEAEAERQGGQ